jgi:hypothetical protein
MVIGRSQRASFRKASRWSRKMKWEEEHCKCIGTKETSRLIIQAAYSSFPVLGTRSA